MGTCAGCIQEDPAAPFSASETSEDLMSGKRWLSSVLHAQIESVRILNIVSWFCPLSVKSKAKPSGVNQGSKITGCTQTQPSGGDYLLQRINTIKMNWCVFKGIVHPKIKCPSYYSTLLLTTICEWVSDVSEVFESTKQRYFAAKSN